MEYAAKMRSEETLGQACKDRAGKKKPPKYFIKPKCAAGIHQRHDDGCQSLTCTCTCHARRI